MILELRAGRLGRNLGADLVSAKGREGALRGRMALLLISFDYKPCPGVCASKLSDWIAVLGLN